MVEGLAERYKKPPHGTDLVTPVVVYGCLTSINLRDLAGVLTLVLVFVSGVIGMLVDLYRNVNLYLWIFNIVINTLDIVLLVALVEIGYLDLQLYHDSFRNLCAVALPCNFIRVYCQP